ncbi:hypothetical protein [Pseudobacillus badius]|uniref:hypothetical protein n=1 Tax=Bacillus badius TaxID=1455 RepID=UPI0007B098E8|nr:hypothetical protein [Bacillus badius]KZN99269.1 hypothetical protein A4244_19330 [Bacillus badius]OCS84291.1 hypothetical protein A6M11_19345 [Bacillus badius]OVE47753.1 hypothetical protein B1A98_18230 [Bacillus badius]TDV99734.1 cytochrome c oxidase subunit 4 [Bacillus badius]
MVGLLNIGSLVFGLIAWILPAVHLQRHAKSWAAFSVMSISACAISLCFQIFNTYHLVKIGDWTALMDIMGGVAFSAAVLLIVTVVLNVTTLLLYRGKTQS